MKARGILPMEKKELKKKLEATYLDIAIPSNVENLQLPDPTLLQFYKNYDDRIIWIDDEITTMTLEYAKMSGIRKIRKIIFQQKNVNQLK